jgi:hypothetical protein
MREVNKYSGNNNNNNIKCNNTTKYTKRSKEGNQVEQLTGSVGKFPPLPMAQQPPVGQGLPTVEASRSHSDTPHSVGLLWTRDRPVAETST